MDSLVTPSRIFVWSYDRIDDDADDDDNNNNAGVRPALGWLAGWLAGETDPWLRDFSDISRVF